jgi:hypothetical protein
VRARTPGVTGANRRALWIGLIAAAFAVAAICFAIAAISAPLATGDETAHLDYAIQVWHGHLPIFENGLQSNPPAFASVPPVQWEAQHPPLFYALMAPIAGPLADAGDWVGATVAVRLANAVLTAFIALAGGWTAWLLGGRDRASRAITATAVTTTIGAVIFVGGSAFSDTINTLMSALAIGVALFAITRGLSVRVIGAACVVSILGALGRTEFIIAFVALLAGLVLAASVQTVPRIGRLTSRFAIAAVAVALPVVSAALASGWFYLRNRRLTGNFEGSHPAWAAANLGRHHLSLKQVLTNRVFLDVQVSLLRHPIDGRSPTPRSTEHTIDTVVLLTVFGIVALFSLLALARIVVRALREHDRVRLAIIVVLALMIALTFAFEIGYMSSGGETISRYLLPGLVPIVLFLSAGLRIVSRTLRPYLLGGYLLICYAMFAYWLLDQPHPAGGTPTDIPLALVIAVVPVIIIVAIVVAAAARASQSQLPERVAAAPLEEAVATV